MKASVVVPTLRPGPLLVELLCRLADELPPESELILVRSGVASDVPVPAPVDAALSAVRARTKIVCVPTLGLANARQAGLEASGDIALYIDDDCLPEPGWYAGLREAMRDGAAAAGGAIVVDWAGGLAPTWLPASMRSLYGERSAGPEARHRPFGANMALRRDPAMRAGGFRRDLGAVGDVPLMHEETELCERIAGAGGRVVEATRAVVHHQVRADQVRRAWIVRRSWHEGRSDARRDGVRRGRRAAQRVAKLVALVAVWPLALRPRARVYATARIAHHFGYLTETMLRRGSGTRARG